MSEEREQPQRLTLVAGAHDAEDRSLVGADAEQAEAGLRPALADGAGWRRGAKTTGLHGRCAALTKSTNSWRAIISAEHGYLPPSRVNWRGNRAPTASSVWRTIWTRQTGG